jgi:predicted Zn-dependent protease
MEIPKDISGGLNALKQAKKLGDDTSKFVSEIQSDMEKTVQSEQKKRVQERRQQEQLLINAELAAIRKFEEELQREELVKKLKTDLTAKHGKDAWAKVEKYRGEIQEQNTQDMKFIDRDRHRVQDLLWYCIGVAALIAYFFKLYKV